MPLWLYICGLARTLYTVHIRYLLWQENHQIYGHGRCIYIYMILANPTFVLLGGGPCGCDARGPIVWSPAPFWAPRHLWLTQRMGGRYGPRRSSGGVGRLYVSTAEWSTFWAFLSHFMSARVGRKLYVVHCSYCILYDVPEHCCTKTGVYHVRVCVHDLGWPHMLPLSCARPRRCTYLCTKHDKTHPFFSC